MGDPRTRLRAKKHDSAAARQAGSKETVLLGSQLSFLSQLLICVELLIPTSSADRLLSRAYAFPNSRGTLYLQKLQEAGMKTVKGTYEAPRRQPMTCTPSSMPGFDEGPASGLARM